MILFFPIVLHAQSQSEVLASIDEEVRLIDKDSSLTRVVLKGEEVVSDVLDGGISLSGYYSSAAIRKIVSWAGLSNGNQVISYYFKNRRLIFVREQFDSFVYDTKNNQIDLSQTETTFRGSYYFQGERLIDLSSTGHNRFENDQIDPEAVLLNEARSWMQRLDRTSGP